MWLALAAAALLVLFTAGDYGVTWDEGIQSKYGEQVLAYFKSGLKDTKCNEDPVLASYGPLPELIPAAIYGANEKIKYDIRHLVLGLMTVLLIPAVILYTRLFELPPAPPLAVLGVILLPRLYGDWFNNSKDTPLAVAVVWFMVALTTMLVRQDFSWRRIVACAMAMGLALCARPGGFPLLSLYALFAIVLSLLTVPRPARSAVAAPRRAGAILAFKALMGVVIAWIIMVLPWPWAHENIIANPIEAMRTAMAFPATYPVMFEGQIVGSGELPWYYMPKFVVMTTPPTLLALAGVGAVIGVAHVIRQRRTRQAFMYGLTLGWLLLPLAAFVILQPNVYDGLRHFLFALPALGILAGLGAAGIIRSARQRRMPLLAWPPVLVLLLLPVLDLIRLHPYQTTYFNFLAGGMERAEQRYDTDYWASSYREAMLWINQQAARDPQRRIVVYLAGGSSIQPLASYYAARNVDVHAIDSAAGVRHLPPGVDFYIGMTRSRLSERDFTEAPIVHSIGRAGATFSVIKGRQGGR